MRAKPTWRMIGGELAAFLALVALGLALVVPPGFMVGAGRGEPAHIVLCTGHGPVTGPADLGGKGAPARGGKPMPACAFAGHGVTGAAPPLFAPLPIAWSFAAAPAPPLAISTQATAAATPPPARAPPLSRL